MGDVLQWQSLAMTTQKHVRDTRQLPPDCPQPEEPVVDEFALLDGGEAQTGNYQIGMLLILMTVVAAFMMLAVLVFADLV